MLDALHHIYYYTAVAGILLFLLIFSFYCYLKAIEGYIDSLAIQCALFFLGVFADSLWIIVAVNIPSFQQVDQYFFH